MKRKIIYTVTAAMLIAAVSLSGCSKKEAETNQEETGNIIASGSGTGQTGIPVEETEENVAPDGTPVISTQNIDDCIKLCELKGLQVEYSYQDYASDSAAVTYAKLEKKAKVIENNPEAQIIWGDTADIAITTIIDGVKTDDYTFASYIEPVGSKQLDEAVEKALIGKKVKDSFTVDVDYDDDYDYAPFAGKTVTYEITVNQISRPEDPTEEEIKAAEKILSSGSKDDEENAIYTAAKETILENSTFIAYPETYLDNARKTYEQRFVDAFGSIDAYLEKTGLSKAGFEISENEFIVSDVQDRLLLQALEKATGIDESSEEYLRVVGDVSNDSRENEVLYKMILDKVLENAVVQKK